MAGEEGKFSLRVLSELTRLAIKLNEEDGEENADIALGMLTIGTLAMKKANINKKELHTLIDILYERK